MASPALAGQAASCLVYASFALGVLSSMSVAARASQFANRAVRLLTGRQPEVTASEIAAQVDSRPNFIVVVTDDMRDSDWQALPQTREWLGARGTTFPNFMVSTSICSPSRASLFTGMYAHHHGVTHNDDGGEDGGFGQFTQNDLGDLTIASALRNVGYHTGLFGKFLNGVVSEGDIPGGWDEWLATTDRSYYNAPLNDNGRAIVLDKRSQYSTDVLAARARDFIENTPAETPFLLWFTPRAPHGLLEPRQQDRGRYAGARRQRSPDVKGYDNSDKPEAIRNLTSPKLDTLDFLERKRLEMLVATDDAIVSILETAQAAGRLANTVVFVLSDNGYMLGSHGCDTKPFPYRETTQITMIASGPSFAAGVTDPRVTGTIDVAPTIAALAGVSLPEADGIPIFERTPKSKLLIEDAGGDRGYVGIRSATWLYVEYGSGERELYDYRHDPYELDNLLASWNGHTPTAEAEATAANLSSRLRRLRTCAGVTCR
jgi:N-acetylglucosamine-6-sulfatase